MRFNSFFSIKSTKSNTLDGPSFSYKELSCFIPLNVDDELKLNVDVFSLIIGSCLDINHRFSQLV